MDGLVKNVLWATFILSTLWESSESYGLDYRTYGNRTLGRFRRQTQGQSCKGDISKFQCATTVDCIDVDLECDGKEDCPDGSDEKESLCKDFPCPGYLFRCEYGACISSDQRCNGQKDCNDNSDEVNCAVTNRINTNCRSDQFECSNGQCIEIDGKCNGIAECDDKSDETEELCFNIFCPGYTYKCRYGACVDGDSECNGVPDCIDNSDEDVKKCSAQPTTVKPLGAGKRCKTPLQPEHGQWVYPINNRKGASNIYIDTNSVITFSCDDGFKLSATNEPNLPVLCMATGEWSITVMPTCKKLCPAVYNSPLITLSCKADGSQVLCDKATDNTILTYKCAPYYEPPNGRPKSSVCFDGSWDYTPKCIPVCGEKRVSATPLVVNGYEVERGHYPWVVALYSSKESDPYFTNICGASLISTEVVLTAAHCVTKKETGKIYPTKYFRIGAGKYYNTYQDAKDNDTAQYAEITTILTHPEYKGEVQNFRGDIALLKLKTPLALSKVVQPVCYNNLPPLEPNTYGLVTGWGYTTTTGEPSEKLKEIDLPYNDDEKCFNELDPDFALRYFTTDKLCAGFNNQSRSVCKGDSGGGLVFRNPGYKNRFFIHGVVSLAHSYTENQKIHCNVQKSALFTKVDTYIEWIQLTVLQWTQNKVEIR